MITPRGEPIARGRSADLYDLGDGTLLRRRRGGDIPAHEAIAMRLAERAGFPVPGVHAVAGRDMVIDRVDGTDMVDLLGRAPWRAAAYGRILAELHLALREIAPSDPDLRGDEPREALVHGDLHPGNVLVSAGGPVVIDWESARAGPSDFDAATTWLLMEVAEVDDVAVLIRPILARVRATLTRAFLRRVGRPRPATVDRVCELRLGDANLRPVELARIREFRARHGTGGTAGRRS